MSNVAIFCAYNSLAAALNNVDVIKAAYQTAENSEGSAERELTNYQKGKFVYPYVQKCA